MHRFPPLCPTLWNTKLCEMAVYKKSRKRPKQPKSPSKLMTSSYRVRRERSQDVFPAVGTNRAWRGRGREAKNMAHYRRTAKAARKARMMSRTFGCVTVKALGTGVGVSVDFTEDTRGGGSNWTRVAQNGVFSDFWQGEDYKNFPGPSDREAERDNRRAWEWAIRRWPRIAQWNGDHQRK